jgi:hypothetical protein
MLPPAVTGLGVPALVTARSQRSTTSITTVVLLLPKVGSEVVAVTEELAVIVPPAVFAGTFTTTTMSAALPEPRAAESEQTTFPVDPTAGVVHVQPDGASTDSNVVFVGVASVN